MNGSSGIRRYSDGESTLPPLSTARSVTAHAPGGLLGAPGAESSALSGRPRAALPAGLVRTLDWLDAHPDEAFDLGRLALIAEVRPRTLEAQFRLYLDTSPLGWRSEEHTSEL